MNKNIDLHPKRKFKQQHFYQLHIDKPFVYPRMKLGVHESLA